MKKLFFLLLALAFTSCSAEIVENLPLVEDLPQTALSVQGLSGSLKLTFDPVAYAKQYAYQIEGSDLTEESVTVENGRYVMTIDNVSSPSGTVELYARNNETSQWTLVGSASFTLSMEGVVIDAYVARRDRNEVEIGIYSSADQSSVLTTVVVEDENGNTIGSPYIFRGVSSFVINGLEPDMAYTLQISQAFESGEGGVAETSLNVPVFTEEVSMTLAVTDEGFVVSSSTGTTLGLYCDEELVLDGISVNDSVVSIPFSSLKSLVYGSFHVESDDGNTSNIIKYRTPLVPKNIEVNWKSIFVTFDFADDFNSEEWAVSLAGGLSSSTSFEGDKLMITGLDSNTDYGDVTVRFADNTSHAVESCTLENIVTNSFAGLTFKWEGTLKAGLGSGTKNTSFIVEVEESPEGSDFPYYVYFSNSDPAVIEPDKQLRLMPIIDDSEGLGEKREGMPTESNPVDYGTGMAGSLDFSKQNSAYRVNSKKWNSMEGVDPSNWYVVQPDGDATKDVVQTETSSYALIGYNPVITTFEFGERIQNGIAEPYIRFENRANGGMAALGLYTNNNPRQCEEFGDDYNSSTSKYNWYLTMVEV